MGKWATCALILVLPGFAVTVPVGTEIQIRLKTKVATDTSKVSDPVEAVVIVPVIANGGIVIPAGSAVRGAVASVHQTTKPEERATLGLAFSQLEQPSGKPVKIDARIADVDNARESVDDSGVIQGILASESGSARLDQGIAKVAQKYEGLASILEGAKAAVLHTTEGTISYGPGVEMTLKLTKPVDLKPAPPPRDVPASIARPSQLAALVIAQPFQTTAEKPPRPSDITNLMFLGSEAQLKAAFTAAGWSSATELNAMSGLETFKAIAEQRGYSEAPVSTLLLNGQKPAVVFQKSNNTFAQRHHLRLWKRPGTFDGREIWVCAATHDIGIDFSQQNLTFIHKIDSEIDRERAKVVSDLIFAGQVAALALVDRPAVPRNAQNATGDKLITDGKMAVLELK